MLISWRVIQTIIWHLIRQVQSQGWSDFIKLISTNHIFLCMLWIWMFCYSEKWRAKRHGCNSYIWTWYRGRQRCQGYFWKIFRDQQGECITVIVHVVKIISLWQGLYYAITIIFAPLIVKETFRVGLVVSVSASTKVDRGFASRPGHIKDHHKNGTNCPPA